MKKQVNSKKKSKKTDLFRTYMLIIYEDDKNYFDYLNFILDKCFKCNFHYLGITHDKDVDDEGNLIKSHDHIVLYFPNPRSLSSISKETGIPSNYFEIYKDKKTALTYLVHLNHGDKYQYDVNDTYGDLKNELLKYVKNNVLSEEDRVLNLLDLIDSYYKYTSYSSFLRDVCNLGLYDILRRNNYMFLKILDKKNEKFIDNT